VLVRFLEIQGPIILKPFTAYYPKQHLFVLKKEEKNCKRRRTCIRENKSFPFSLWKHYWTGCCWPVCDELRLICECEASDRDTTSLDSSRSVAPDKVRHSGAFTDLQEVCVCLRLTAMTLKPHALRYICLLLLFWKWRVQGPAMRELGSHCHLYNNCLRKDSGAQSYRHQGNRQWSWLPAYTPGLGLLLYLDMRPTHGPFDSKRTWCPMICWPAGSRNASMVVVSGTDAGWKPGGGRMSEKSSWLSDDTASSSSEDMSTTVGCRDVMCVRRAYAYSTGGRLLLRR